MNNKIQAKRNNRKQRLSNKTFNSNDTAATKPTTQTMETSIKQANELWDDLKKRVKDNPEFASLSDSKKIEIYQKSEFKEFYVNFPIVCRYMICMGQFSNKAFHRYLTKCETTTQPDVKREKGFAENEWVKRQADYVRYLWESYQKPHFKSSDAQQIWQHSYDTLKKEFDDFRDMHADVEKKLESDGRHNKAEMVKELLTRMSKQEQSLDQDTTTQLIDKLQTQLIQQRRKKLLTQINSDVELIPPTRITQGSRKELQPSQDEMLQC